MRELTYESTIWDTVCIWRTSSGEIEFVGTQPSLKGRLGLLSFLSFCQFSGAAFHLTALSLGYFRLPLLFQPLSILLLGFNLNKIWVDCLPKRILQEWKFEKKILAAFVYSLPLPSAPFGRFQLALYASSPLDSYFQSRPVFWPWQCASFLHFAPVPVAASRYFAPIIIFLNYWYLNGNSKNNYTAFTSSLLSPRAFFLRSALFFAIHCCHEEDWFLWSFGGLQLLLLLTKSVNIELVETSIGSSRIGTSLGETTLEEIFRTDIDSERVLEQYQPRTKKYNLK